MGLSRFHHVELWQAPKNVIHSLLTELWGMRLHSSDIIHSLFHPCQLTTCKQQQHFKNMMKLVIQQWLARLNITWKISPKCCTCSSTALIYSMMTCFKEWMLWCYGMVSPSGLGSSPDWSLWPSAGLSGCSSEFCSACCRLSLWHTSNAWPTVRTIRMAWLWEAKNRDLENLICTRYTVYTLHNTVYS